MTVYRAWIQRPQDRDEWRVYVARDLVTGTEYLGLDGTWTHVPEFTALDYDETTAIVLSGIDVAAHRGVPEVVRQMFLGRREDPLVTMAIRQAALNPCHPDWLREALEP